MTTVIEAKPKKRPEAPPTKMCLRCHKVKPITSFYKNRDWDDQLGMDAWCKDCAAKCLTKDEWREYFWENHRQWDERAWEAAKRKAEGLAANNLTYQRSSGPRQEKLLEQLTCGAMPTVMAMYYKYFDPDKSSAALSYQEAKELGEIADADPNVKIYSEEFNGMYKPSEIRYLQEYYKNLEDDYDFDTENMRDYGRKVAKASLMADRAQDDYNMGRGDLDTVQKTINMFDTLSKSNNLAACKRKPGESSELNSFGEMALYLETHGHTMQKPVQWEPDDVDKALAELGQEA